MYPQTFTEPARRTDSSDAATRPGNEAFASGVSWAAVMAGAVVTSALSLTLLTLGTGIGFSAVPPWVNGATASTFGWSAIAWLVLIQVVASSIGGYLAGRLRTKWVSVHTHEVYFRDTAHGLLVWAVALVVTAMLLTTAASTVIGGGTQAVVTAASATPSLDGTSSAGYVVDALFRTPTGEAPRNAEPAQIGSIFANGMREGALPSADRQYVARLVAARTNITEAEAGQRVDESYARVAQAAERARKAVAHAMYWTFLSLLVGAFCASFSATIGGNQRDRVIAVNHSSTR